MGIHCMWMGENGNAKSDCLSPVLISSRNDCHVNATGDKDDDGDRGEWRRYMTSFPHLAGTHGERQMAEYIADTWRQQGLTNVQMVPYRVLMSYPDSADPSRVVIYDVRDDSVVFTSQLTEKPLHSDDNLTDTVPPYNVYSPSAIVSVPFRIYLLILSRKVKYTTCLEKRCHCIFDYNSRISWWIFIMFIQLETGMIIPQSHAIYLLNGFMMS